MKVLIASDFTIYRDLGRYYAKTQHSSIIKRYRNAFGQLKICCRVEDANNINMSYEEITQDLDEIVPLTGLIDTLTGRCANLLASKVPEVDLVIGRFHSLIACVAAECAKKYRKPFFAELMGDAWDAYWNHSMVGKLIAPFIFLRTKWAVKRADYALYVTREYLQNRYPCVHESVAVSNVRIDSIVPSVLTNRLKKIDTYNPKCVTLITTAAVDVRYKGHEYVIRAIPLMNAEGLRVRYIMIGDGNQDFLRGIAREYDVEDQIEFVGRLPLDEVFTLLDQADIYIQPSLQEGLPRSVIEAMSRGCPAIGAKTAGIPELISPECVVRRKSAKDIAEKVLSIYNPDRLRDLAKQNFESSKEYLDEVLALRRNTYFEKIKSDLDVK